MQTVYKIRKIDPTTGKHVFSNGGFFPTWGPTGKIWQSRESLNKHLNMFKVKWANDPDSPLVPYRGAVVVPILMTEIPSSIVTVRQWEK